MIATNNAKTLAGKVALVTGAGRGLGRAFAEKLAAMGADVAIHGMRENGPAEYGEGPTLTAGAPEGAGPGACSGPAGFSARTAPDRRCRRACGTQRD